MRKLLYEVATGCANAPEEWFLSLNHQSGEEQAETNLIMESISNATYENDGADDDNMDSNDGVNRNKGAVCTDVEISVNGHDAVTNPRLASLHLQRSLQNQFDTRGCTSKSSTKENGSDPILNELNKAFLALQQSYIGDKEFLGGPVQKFTKKLLELNSGTNTGLASALHCFGRYSGVAGALGKKKKSLVSMKKIGVQPTALARRKMVAGGRHRIGAGRPSKDCCLSRKEAVPFSSQRVPTCRRKAQHNISECVRNNQSLGKTHSSK
ncbi:uncharacterized protein LOC121412628 [Lytechinus variegatus]|uniref:uncharacterized protein LOC121412628 n=1 Tax=Lytechinus variegatus TaxID=7654 RepID=UPI001BB14B8F|nr:uncharacterized protein LOC121412628 [Lytechinus variegatus]